MSAPPRKGLPGATPLLALTCHLLFLHTFMYLFPPASLLRRYTHPSSLCPRLHNTLQAHPFSPDFAHAAPPQRRWDSPLSWQGTCTSLLITRIDFWGQRLTSQDGPRLLPLYSASSGTLIHPPPLLSALSGVPVPAREKKPNSISTCIPFESRIFFLSSQGLSLPSAVTECPPYLWGSPNGKYPLPLQIGLMTAITSALWSQPLACMGAP